MRAAFSLRNFFVLFNIIISFLFNRILVKEQTIKMSKLTDKITLMKNMTEDELREYVKTLSDNDKKYITACIC